MTGESYEDNKLFQKSCYLPIESKWIACIRSCMWDENLGPWGDVSSSPRRSSGEYHMGVTQRSTEKYIFAWFERSTACVSQSWEVKGYSYN